MPYLTSYNAKTYSSPNSHSHASKLHAHTDKQYHVPTMAVMVVRPYLKKKEVAPDVFCIEERVEEAEAVEEVEAVGIMEGGPSWLELLCRQGVRLTLEVLEPLAEAPAVTAVSWGAPDAVTPRSAPPITP